MCTVVVLHRPEHAWPVLLAGNRDEMVNRPWRAPGRHWADRPHVIAGLDEVGNGTWFGLNDRGVAAGIMNRAGTLGPASGKRSRGEIVLAALDHSSADTAVKALAGLRPGDYRAFNLLVADARAVYWLRHSDEPASERIEVFAVPAGLSMLTAYDLNDSSSARIRRYLPLFRHAATPDPGRAEWSSWIQLLASRDSDADVMREGALNVVTDLGFGTVSSFVLGLPAPGTSDEKPRFRFAAGRPDQVPFKDVRLDGAPR